VVPGGAVDLRLLCVRRFSGYAVSLPELFPTHIRSTAVGFCTGSARIATSSGPLVAGLLVGAFGGSFNRVTAFMTCFALLSILAMLLAAKPRVIRCRASVQTHS
jgi:MFS family permease